MNASQDRDSRAGQVDDAEATQNNTPAYYEVGDTVRRVLINVDHAIVKHFSEHLYSSPNKAIEELVANSFDAFATKCFVYVPGDLVANRVAVWDDGLSMGVDGIAAMWQIARSPKELLGPDRVVVDGNKKRRVIGKFGIGKLASYAVGQRITHICKTGSGEYLTASVDYREFTPDQSVGADSTTRVRESSRETKAIAAGEIDEHAAIRAGDVDQEVATPAGDLDEGVATKSSATQQAGAPDAKVRRLSESQAEAAIRAIFAAESTEAVKQIWNAPTWTLAVIDDLRPDKTLYPARLAWIIGNGMPLRPDFEVWVNDIQVEPKLASQCEKEWSLADDAVQAALKKSWATALEESRVEGPEPAALDADDKGALTFPRLGGVKATVRVFGESLASDHDQRSYGFFVMVRGRLVNPDDATLFLSDPSFSTFYRSQFIIEADGLDSELLADRESLRRDTPMARELKVLQQTLYLLARAEVNRSETNKSERARPESRLPVRSRELFRDPMSILASNFDGETKPINLDEPRIDRASLEPGGRLSVLAAESGALQVNDQHPFYREVERQAGGGKRGQSIMRAFELVAVAEVLTEGYLRGIGLKGEEAERILEWRDRLLRALAEGYGKNPDDAILEMRAASVAGDTRFEDAVVAVLTLMGFDAERDGAPGQKDVTVTAPVGPGQRVFIVEAKGSARAVRNVTAAVASAASHRDKVEGATHAVIFAREFDGFATQDEPAILRECRSVGGVSLVTVEHLAALFAAQAKYNYPLETLMDVLFQLEAPRAKSERIQALGDPLADFDYRAFLDEIWEQQRGIASGDQVSLRTVWQSRPEWKSGMSFEDFFERVVALSTLAGPLVNIASAERIAHLTAPPESVAQHIQRTLLLPDHPEPGAGDDGKS